MNNITSEDEDRSSKIENQVEVPALKTGHQTTLCSFKTNIGLGSNLNFLDEFCFLFLHNSSKCSLRLENKFLLILLEFWSGGIVGVKDS